MNFFTRTVLLLIAGVAMATAISACDSCIGIECPALASPVIEIVVTDTVTIDTVINVYDELSGDSIPQATRVVRRAGTFNATVGLYRTENETDVKIDTLSSETGDRNYVYWNPKNLPSSAFMIVASIGSRSDTVKNVKLQETEGCCSYPYAGNFTMELPEAP